MKLILSIITCLITANTLWAGPRPSMADSYNRAIASDSWAIAAKARADAATAERNRAYQQANPWFVDTHWRSLTNNIEIALKQRMVKEQEYILLRNAGQSDTPRGKQLSLFMSNSLITINTWSGERNKIQEDWKLKQFYQANKGKLID